MTEYEERLAEKIVDKYDEDNDFYPYYDRRVYLDLNGVLSSQGEKTDILFVVYTIDKEYDRRYIQLFISSPDDRYQDYVYFADLTDEEKVVIEPKIMEQVLAR